MRFSRDTVLGSIAGGAIGDSLGGIAERGRLCLSDDTQLTIATCEAIAALGGIEPESIAASLLRWFRARSIVGIGSSTLKALRDLDAGAHWALSGARGEMASGNGAAMRIAPLAFALDPFAPKSRTTIRDVCRITHHSDEAYIGALAVLLAIHTDSREQRGFLLEICDSLPDSRVRDRLIELGALDPMTPLDQIASHYGASGYVAESVPLALVVASRMVRDGFDTSLRSASEIPGDTDTICAIAGQIAGAHLGFSRLPDALLKLEPVVEAVALSRDFAMTVGSDA